MSTVIYNMEGRPLLYVPAWFEGQATRLLKYVNAATTSDPELRKKICRREPLIFGLVYFRHHLASEETDNKRSLNPLHIWLAEHAATYWPFPLEPKECRVGVVAPRESGKTTWIFLILPAWAGAYGWRIYQAFFSDSRDRAEQHLANLRIEFAENERLRADFPELCEPDKRNGRSVGDSASVFRSRSGVAFIARGIDAKNLGAKERRARPDLIVIDDVEPISKYSRASKEARLNTILNGLLPMNENAAVYLVGTVVRYGSIMHEVVLADTGGGIAPWIEQERFTTKYWPVYTHDSKTGEYVSFWPEKWSMEYIRREMHTATFQLGKMNQPVVNSNGLFTQKDLHYGAPFVVVEHTLAIDPAVSSRETSDFTGIAVVGFDGGRRHALVEKAIGVKLDPERMVELIRLIFIQFPTITTVSIEGNQGGDYVYNQLSQAIPRGVRVLRPHEGIAKPIRIRELHEWCQRRWVFLGPNVHAFVSQALEYPDVDHDDVIDAVARACEFNLRKVPVPSR